MTTTREDAITAVRTARQTPTSAGAFLRAVAMAGPFIDIDDIDGDMDAGISADGILALIEYAIED